jgi:hypothetical protein
VDSSLFIHHNPASQPWVIPYYENRVLILNKFNHIKVSGNEMFTAFDVARMYFGVDWVEYPGYTVMSDWIRCHKLLTIKRLLYSDSDVFWHSQPELGDKPLKGDTTFGIMWNGDGLPDSAKSYAFSLAKSTKMSKNINSNYLIPINDRINSKCFYHGKELASIFNR